MKVIAMYLPQFHRTKENDEWWGEGFTDWKSAQMAEPCFEGHYQPHVPLNNNYYNLLEKETLEWQADVMHKYGVDGMCFYHYWFENGRRILEKPAENLLEWKDIRMPFCFSWANESWARSWSNVKESNVWSNVNEPEIKGGPSILLKQEYGSKKEWKEHFEYLYDFFVDDRYIKIQGKPIFLIYKVGMIGCIDEMLTYWNELAKEKGLPGLYIIGSNTNGVMPAGINAELVAEPQNGLKELVCNTFCEGVKSFSYQDVWDKILATPIKKNTYYGGFVGYDDSPRRGCEGVVINGATPEVFRDNLTKLVAKNHSLGNELVFINAWNEWGEGMHLEPDEKFGYEFLEQINYAKENYEKVQLKSVDSQPNVLLQRSADKFELYLNDLDRWMTLREKNIRISEILKKKNFRKIAIYGYGIMGRHLETELISDQESGVECCFIIDAQKNKIHAQHRVYSPSEELPKVDAIIVASYFYLDEVCLEVDVPIISLGSIIHEIYSEGIG